VEALSLAVGDLVFDAVATGPADGRLVLLLHGFPQTSHSWRRVWPGLGWAATASSRRTSAATPPAPGPTASSLPAARQLVADVVGCLDALGADQATSSGTTGARRRLAARRAGTPSRVRTLHRGLGAAPAGLRRGAAHRRRPAPRSLYMRDFGRPATSTSCSADDAAALRDVFAAVPEVDRRARAEPPGHAGGAAPCLDWYAAQSLEDATGLGPVTAPTLHVWSDDDRALGEAGARATERYVDGPYRFEVLRGVTHWVPEQAADALAALVLEHLAAHPA
jgi:pimeloyl-ACP methyl ester carboxylesterase